MPASPHTPCTCDTVQPPLMSGWPAAVVCCLQDSDGTPAVDRLFGLKLRTKLKCEETGEEFEVRIDSYSCCRFCHIFTALAVVQCC
jgi:hypothetical protein